MSETLGYVLLPGGGMSGWIWERLREQLHRPSVVVENRIEPNDYAHRKHAKFIECIDYTAAQMHEAPFEHCILVGHSGAGALAASVAKHYPERIRHILYIAANIPRHDATLVDGLPFLIKWLNIIAVRTMIKNDAIPYTKVEKTVRRKFCNTCDEPTIQYVLKQELRSEPLCVVTEKMDWTNFPPIPQTYIVLTHDHTLSVEKQTLMASHLQITDLKEIASDHMVMLSHPGELAAMMNTLAADLR